jgi:membrane associated rhomboid family serine protease
MATIALFLVGVLSLLLFDPVVTAYLYNEPSWMWRFVNVFTHMVSHGNWDHLIGNFIFGAPFMLYLEHKLKSTKTFVRLFFGLGLCAFFSQLLLDSVSLFHSSGMIGSSGAIFGLTGAALILYDGPKPIQIAAKVLTCFYVLTQAQAAIISTIFPLGVAYGAHLGGLIGGILFSLHRRRRHLRLCRQNRANRSRKRRP